MSPALRRLLRALTIRAGIPSDRILLIEWASVDWHSLTFVGERHEAQLRVTGADSDVIAMQIVDGLDDAEFNIPGQIFADIAAVGAPIREDDGSTLVCIEAVTVAE
jgi:hypothetical protein